MHGPQRHRPQAATTDVGASDDLRLTPSGLRRLTGVFAVVLAALAAGHVLFLLVPSLHLLSIFDLADERSFGTWVGSSLHLVCAALSAVGAVVAGRDGSRWRANWWLLAAAFLVMSADETASGHDRLVDPLQDRLQTTGVLLYPWVVAGLLLATLFFMVQLRFVRSLGRTGLWLVCAGGVFVLGAGGLEMVEGVVASPGGPRRDSLLYELLVMGEELMEVGALMAVACILLSHLTTRVAGTRLIAAPGVAAQTPQPPRVAG